MDKLTPSLAAETDAPRETYAALNRNDIEAAVKNFDTEIAWIEPAIGSSCTYNLRVRLKHETEWREGRHAAVYTFLNGKAVEMRIFDDTAQALEWAGVATSDAN